LPKILIIRFSSIGDIVLTTPVVRCIKQQLPGAEVHYLTKRSFSGIPASNPGISKVYSISRDVAEVIGQLKKERYDHVIDLHNNIRSAQVKMKLGRPSSTFRKLNLKKWLLVNLKWDLMPPLHVVDRYMEAVKGLGVVNDEKGLDYFIPAEDEVKVSELGLCDGDGTSTHGPYIAFVVGAKHNTKQLPVEKIISICKKIKQPVVLLGGSEDAENGERISSAAGANVLNACGRYNLNQSASLVRQAAKVITHDTGLMHIASAFGKEIISVWGNTVPAFGMYPYLPGEGSCIIEVEGLPCRPCSKIGYPECPQGHFKCMRLIDEHEVIKAVER
jgi:ADP-heptose:LPS heptosyltransferase